MNDTDNTENREKMRYVMLSALAFGLAMAGVFRVTTGSWLYAFHGGVVSGFLFGLAIFKFMKIQLAPPAASRDGFDDDEVIAHHGPANHMKGMEAVGGKLFLTSTRLRFKSHAFNLQAHDESYPVGDIEGVEPVRTMGIIPNAIRVHIRDAKSERFVVMSRGKWIAAINLKISAAEATRKSR